MSMSKGAILQLLKKLDNDKRAREVESAWETFHAMDIVDMDNKVFMKAENITSEDDLAI